MEEVMTDDNHKSFICPRCGAVNQVSRAKYPYCNNRVNGELCGYKLNDDERLQFKAKRERKRKFKSGISLREASTLKFCSRKTILNNLKCFDIIEGSHPVRIVFNKKFMDWQPKRQRGGRERRL
jgi:hypothetical protein